MRYWRKSRPRSVVFLLERSGVLPPQVEAIVLVLPQVFVGYRCHVLHLLTQLQHVHILLNHLLLGLSQNLQLQPRLLMLVHGSLSDVFQNALRKHVIVPASKYPSLVLLGLKRNYPHKVLKTLYSQLHHLGLFGLFSQKSVLVLSYSFLEEVAQLHQSDPQLAQPD